MPKTILKIIIALTLALTLTAALWFPFEAAWDRQLFGPTKNGGFAKNIRPAEAATLLETEPSLQILDLRSAREAKNGSLPNAIRISFGTPRFTDRLRTELDPSKPVLVHCAGGFRSRRAIPRLKEAGFTQIYHLHRGLLGQGAQLTSP
jgi:rhodanese-related sulfurtransferase